MSTSPEIIPVDGAGSGGNTSQPAPVLRTAPTYKAPVAAPVAPPLPAQGLTVMNADGSFYTSDFGPQAGGLGPDSQDGGADALMQMLLLSKLLGNKKRTSSRRSEKQPPQIIVVQVPANSLPVESAPDLRDPSLVGSYTAVTKTKLKK